MAVDRSVENPRWRKSSFSGGNDGGDCVEVADLVSGGVLLRHSKDPDGPVLAFTELEWVAFVQGVVAGEFGPWPF